MPAPYRYSDAMRTTLALLALLLAACAVDDSEPAPADVGEVGETGGEVDAAGACGLDYTPCDVCTYCRAGMLELCADGDVWWGGLGPAEDGGGWACVPDHRDDFPCVPPSTVCD
jgi:hypothetical protein